MNTLVCSANSFTVYCTLLFFLLFTYRGKLTGSLAHTSALKKKVDKFVFGHLAVPFPVTHPTYLQEMWTNPTTALQQKQTLVCTDGMVPTRHW